MRWTKLTVNSKQRYFNTKVDMPVFYPSYSLERLYIELPTHLKSYEVTILGLTEKEKNSFPWEKFKYAAILIFQNSISNCDLKYSVLVYPLYFFTNFGNRRYSAIYKPEVIQDYIASYLDEFYKTDDYLNSYVKIDILDYFFIINGVKTKGAKFCKTCPNFEERYINGKCVFSIVNCPLSSKLDIPKINPEISFLDQTAYRKPKDLLRLEPFKGYDASSIITDDEAKQFHKERRLQQLRAKLTARFTRHACKYCIFYDNYTKKRRCGRHSALLTYPIFENDQIVQPHQLSFCGGPYTTNNFNLDDAIRKLFKPWEVHVLSYYRHELPINTLRPLFKDALYRRRNWPWVHIPHLFGWINGRKSEIFIDKSTAWTNSKFVYLESNFTFKPGTKCVHLVIPFAVLLLSYQTFCKILKEPEQKVHSSQFINKLKSNLFSRYKAEDASYLIKCLFGLKHRLKEGQVSGFEYYNLGDVPWCYKPTRTTIHIDLTKNVESYNLLSEMRCLKDVRKQNGQILRKIYEKPTFKAQKTDYPGLI